MNDPFFISFVGQQKKIVRCFERLLNNDSFFIMFCFLFFLFQVKKRMFYFVPPSFCFLFTDPLRMTSSSIYEVFQWGGDDDYSPHYSHKAVIDRNESFLYRNGEEMKNLNLASCFFLFSKILPSFCYDLVLCFCFFWIFLLFKKNKKKKYAKKLMFFPVYCC